MPDGPDINIAFKTTADSSGADQTVADVKQVTEEIEAQGQALVEVGEKAEEMGPKLDRMVGMQRAMIVAQVGQVFGQLGMRMREMARDMEKFDKDLAETLKASAERVEAFSNILASGAMGFQVGGPWGAAIGAALASIPQVQAEVGKLAESFFKMSEADQAAADKTDAALARIVEQRAAGVANLLGQYKQEEAALDRLVEKATRLAKLRGFKDLADAAERDAADAEEKRNGVDPEIVDKRRALADAAAAKEKIAGDIAEKGKIEQAAAQAYNNAKARRKELEGMTGVTEKEIDEAYKQQRDAEAEWQKKKDERVFAQQSAPDLTRKIDAQTGAKVAALDEHQRQRIFAEDRKAEEAKRRAEEQWARDRGSDARDSLDSGRENLNTRARSAAHDIFQRAAGGGRGPRDPNIIAASGVANALADGTSAKELEALGRKVDANVPRASDAMVRLLHTLIGNLQDQAAKVQAMEGQVKNLRAGK